jgi:hypothetical protein
MLRRSHISVLLLLGVVACSDATAPNPVGSWQAADAGLVLSPTGGNLVYSCGAGTIDSGWTFSRTGKFTATGKHYFGGGPVPPEGHPPHPASYLGQLTGDHLLLKVTLTDLDQVLGPFDLVRGGPPVLELCL